jgi:hypothetical protein
VEHAGWALTNLAIPYFGPLLVVKTIRLLLSEERHPTLRKRLRVTYLLREGQYALTSLAVTMAALYELTELAEWTSRSKAWLGVIVFFALFATMLIVLGLISDTEDPETAIPPGSGVLRWSTIRKWVHTYRVGAATIMLVGPVSIAAYSIHDAVASRHQSAQVSSPQADNKSAPKP